MAPSAHFITFEGGEGVGKSTQIKLLADSMRKAGLEVMSTREPGGSPGAEAIRTLVVEGAVDAWNPTTEALLFMAARYDHLHHLILPALARGEWVLCDRFFDSTFVYQGVAKAVGETWLRQLYAHLYGNVGPEWSVLFDLDPTIGLARAASRGGAEARFEAMGLAYHTQVREGFRACVAAEPARWVTMDAADSIARVHASLVEAVNTRFGLALAPVSLEEAV
jgi:dTMP kinase